MAEKPRLIVTKGLPASGKSTWAKAFVAQHPNFVRINKDDIRAMMGGNFSRQKESVVLAIRDCGAGDALESGMGVIIDDTNFSPEHEETLRKIAKFHGVPFEINFFDVPLEECVRRNSERPNKVPEQVIRDMAKKYNVGRAKLVQDLDKPSAFIFDIDGTLAKMNGRSPYDYSKVITDLPNEDVVDICNMLAFQGHEIIVVSGREGTEQCRLDTESWLEFTACIPYGQLHMRKAGDKRSDDIVKREILENEILPHYRVRGVFDDRDRVVKMWRDVGLTCYQVDYGNF